MAERENIRTLMDIFEAFNRNDVERAAEGLDPEVVYIIRGQASVSGTYRGREAFAAALRRIKDLTGGTMRGTPEVVTAKGDQASLPLSQRQDARGTDDSGRCQGVRGVSGRVGEGPNERARACVDGGP